MVGNKSWPKHIVPDNSTTRRTLHPHSHIARQKSVEAHVTAALPGDNLVQCRDGQRSAGRRRALVHAAERAEGALDGRPSDPILGR